MHCLFFIWLLFPFSQGFADSTSQILENIQNSIAESILHFQVSFENIQCSQLTLSQTKQPLEQLVEEMEKESCHYNLNPNFANLKFYLNTVIKKEINSSQLPYEKKIQLLQRLEKCVEDEFLEARKKIALYEWLLDLSNFLAELLEVYDQEYYRQISTTPFKEVNNVTEEIAQLFPTLPMPKFVPSHNFELVEGSQPEEKIPPKIQIPDNPLDQLNFQLPLYKLSFLKQILERESAQIFLNSMKNIPIPLFSKELRLLVLDIFQQFQSLLKHELAPETVKVMRLNAHQFFSLGRTVQKLHRVIRLNDSKYEKSIEKLTRDIIEQIRDSIDQELKI